MRSNPDYNPNAMMGEAQQPYSVASISHSAPRRESGMSNRSAVMVLGVFVVLGALAVWYLRNNPPVQSGPVVQLMPPAAPDQSSIDNLTASINAAAGQVHTASATPTGGASTPQTTVG